MTRFSLDSNVLVYAADRNERRGGAARQIVASAAYGDCVPATLALGEFFHAATRKGRVPVTDASGPIQEWLSIFPAPLPYGVDELRVAMQARASGRFQFWDAMVLATAGATGCVALISEDMTHGATLGGVQVVRAFDGDAVSPEALALPA